MVCSLEGMSGIFDTFQKLELNSSSQQNAALYWGRLRGIATLTLGRQNQSKYHSSLKSFWFSIIPDPYRWRLKIIPNIYPFCPKITRASEKIIVNDSQRCFAFGYRFTVSN